MKKVDKPTTGSQEKDLKLQKIVILIIFVSLLISIGVLISQVNQNKEQIEYANFIDTLKYYDLLKQDRINNWVKIKGVVTSNPKTSWEIGDKQDSISYLMLRVNQNEPLYAIEHGHLEMEIKSLNLLNELSKMAYDNNRLSILLKLTHSSEIFYYQNRLDDLLYLYENEKVYRPFSKPRYDTLKDFIVNDFFEDIN